MKTIRTIGVLTALAFGAFSASANESYMRVKVPFSFVVAGQQFAPGDYTISQNEAGVILVQGAGKGAVTGCKIMKTWKSKGRGWFHGLLDA